jgi:hypothetical protein
MHQTLDRLVLDIPYLFLKKIPYAWIGVIALWSWPPTVSGVLFAIILIGLIIMRWQAVAWRSRFKREHGMAGKFYIDRPRAPLAMQVRNLAILFALSGLFGWLVNGQFGLSGWQLFFLAVGLMLLYKDALLFGASVTYIVTYDGIGIHFIPGHVDYRLFFSFKEISHVERMNNLARTDWSIIAPTRAVREGLLLTPKNPDGFSRQIQKVFIAPGDIGKFLEQIPPGFVSAFQGR